MKHLLSIEAMDDTSIETILENAGVMKSQRGDSQHQPLAGQTCAIIFTKSSTRTRVSFEVGIRELGVEDLAKIIAHVWPASGWCLLPPLNISNQDADEGLAIIKSVIKELAQ